MRCENWRLRDTAAMERASERISEQISARSAQKCVQARIPWPQCRVNTNSHTSCVNHHMVVGA
eukprot:11169622-Lingulodinium_polyedra.AAC.1